MRALLTSISRDKVRTVLGILVIVGLFVSLFLSYRANADSVSNTVQSCIKVVPVVEISAQQPDAAEQDTKSAKILVKYTGEIKPGASQVQIEISLTGDAHYGSNKDYIFSRDSTDSTSSPEASFQSSPDRMIVIFRRIDPKEKVVLITPVDDSEVDKPGSPDPEEVKMRIIPQATDSSTYTVGTQKEASVYIYDNDTETPVMRIEATDPNAAEQGQDPGTFTISSSKKVTSDTIIDYRLSGSATNESDYVTRPLVGVMRAGMTSTTVTVEPVDDSEDENDEVGETVIATLVEGGRYTVSPIQSQSSATVTIADNDGLPTVTITPETATVKAGETGTITVHRTGPLTKSLNVQITTGGDALLATHYTLSATIMNEGRPTVIIESGKDSQTFTIKPTGITQGTMTATLRITEKPAEYRVGTPNVSTVSLVSNRTSWLKSWLIAPAQAADTSGCIYGIVRDKKTNQPLPYVQVELSYTQLPKISTDSMGRYEFKGLDRTKTYTVQASRRDAVATEYDVTPNAEVNFLLAPTGNGVLTGTVREKLPNGTYRPVPGAALFLYSLDKDPSTDASDYQRDETGSQGEFAFRYIDKTKPYQIQVLAFGFQDLISKPHQPDKENIVLTLERQIGTIQVRGMGRLPGEVVRPIEVPNLPGGLPAIKFSIKVKNPSDKNRSNHIDETVFPTQKFETRVPTFRLPVPTGEYEVHYDPADNPEYELFSDSPQSVDIDVTTDGTDPDEVVFSATKKLAATGTIVDRKLLSMENIPTEESCDIGQCRGIMKDIVNKLGISRVDKITVHTIPPKIVNGYDVTIEHKDLKQPITGRTALKSGPSARTEFQTKVRAADGYVVTNKTKAAVCVLVVTRFNNKTQKKYVRLTGVDFSLSNTVSVPENGTGEARWTTFPTVQFGATNIDSASVQNLGWQGLLGNKSKNLCMKQS